MVFRLSVSAIACLGFTAALMADVLVDDFDDAVPAQTTLGHNLYVNVGPTTHTGYWYGFTDKDNAGNSKLIPDVYSTKVFAPANVTGGTSGAKCLHIVMALGDAFTSPYCAVGFQINVQSKGDYQDLSAMTGFSFQAKGKGSMRVHFVTQMVEKGYPAGKNWGDFGAEATLTPNWKLYTMTTADLKPQAGSPQAKDNLTWAQCSNQVSKIHFQSSPMMGAGDTLDLWMDDIWMQGVTPATFGGAWIDPVIYHAASTKRTNPMQVFANAGNLTVQLSSPGNVSTEVYSLSGGLVQKYSGYALQKAVIQVPVTNGKYVAKVSSKSGLMTLPITIQK